MIYHDILTANVFWAYIIALITQAATHQLYFVFVRNLLNQYYICLKLATFRAKSLSFTGIWIVFCSF